MSYPVGTHLKVTPGTTSGGVAPLVTTYQWKLDGVDIGGATNIDYTTENDGELTCVQTVTDDDSVVISAETVAVTIVPDTTAPTLSSVSPLDNATGVAIGANLVATFSENVVAGTGNVVIRNLSDTTETTIPITDPQCSIVNNVLTIRPTSELVSSKNYAVRIAATAVLDIAGNPFAGIANDTIWNFSTAEATMPAGALGIWYGDQYTDSPRPYIPNAVTGGTSHNLVAVPRGVFSSRVFMVSGTLTATDYAAAGPDGLTEASTIDGASGSKLSFRLISTFPAGTFTMAMWVKRNTGSDQTFRMAVGSNYQTFTATGTWQRVSFTFTRAAGSDYVYPVDCTGGAANIQICDLGLFAGASDLGAEPLAGHLMFGASPGAGLPTFADNAVDLSAGAVGVVQFPTVANLGSFTIMGLISKVAAGTSYACLFSKLEAYSAFSMYTGAGTYGFCGEFAGMASKATQGGDMPRSLLNDGYHFMVWRYNGVSMDLFMDDVLLLSASRAPSGSVALRNLALAFVNDLTNSSGNKLAAAAYYNSALSNSEVAIAKNHLLGRSGKTVSSPSRIIAFEGDSITASASYVKLVMAQVATKAYGSILAVSGTGISAAAGRAADLQRMKAASSGVNDWILSILIGTNDINSSNTTSWLASLAAYADARRAEGWQVVCCTVLPTNSADFNTGRNIVNTAIRTWVGVHCDAVADLAANTDIGEDADGSNTSLYPDGIHPTAAVYAIMAPIITAAIDSL